MTAFGLLAALALLVGNALFVAAEFAAVSVRRAQIEPLAATSRRARRVLEAQRRLSLLLAGAQLGITLCSLGLGAVAEPAVASVLESVLHAAHLPAHVGDPAAFVVALALVVLAHMVIGEMVPKNISLATSERAALLLVPALDTFVRCTRPVIRALNALANLGLRVVRVQPQDELKSAYTAEELADILAESRDGGFLGEGEHDRLANALSFSDRTAADVLIPLTELVTVTPATTVGELEQLTARTGFSRFPLSRNGDLVGFVHVKDVLTADTEPDRAWPERHLHPLPSIAPDLELPEVLSVLRRARSHLGLVPGRGVVALEDVVEQFVGEISDASNLPRS